MPLTRRALLEKSLSLGAGIGVSLVTPPLTCEAATDDTLALTHATLIDATGRPPLTDRTIIVRGDRIRKIGESRKTTPPKNARVVDVSGKYVIPGLWDAHVHARGTPELFADNEAWFTLYIANGITGVREMGGDYVDSIFRWRTEAARNTRLGPRILSSGPKVEGPEPKLHGSFAVKDAASARAAVGKLKMMGADFIKIHSDEFPADGFAALMDEAHKQQLIVGGHLPFMSMTNRDAVKSGVRFFEHATLFPLGGCSKNEKEINDECRTREATRQRMSNAERMHRYALTFDQGLADDLSSEFVKRNVWVTPTLIVLRQLETIGRVDYSQHPQRKYLSSTFWRTWDRPDRPPFFSDNDIELIGLAHEKTAAMLRTMQAAGVGLLAGTDCSWSNPYTFPGWTLHQELELLVKCGLSPMQVLQMATRNPARFLDELDTHGTAEEGKAADLVVLNANPLDDIRNTQKIDSLIMRGRFLARTELDGLLGNVAEKAASYSPTRAALNASVSDRDPVR